MRRTVSSVRVSRLSFSFLWLCLKWRFAKNVLLLRSELTLRRINPLRFKWMNINYLHKYLFSGKGSILGFKWINITDNHNNTQCRCSCLHLIFSQCNWRTHTNLTKKSNLEITSKGRTLSRVFSCKFCKTSHNNFFWKRIVMNVLRFLSNLFAKYRI